MLPAMRIRTVSFSCLIGAALAATAVASSPSGPAPSPEAAKYRQWIAEMKASSQGPFARIRWFCNDGTVLPPKAYACRPHGGGVQHGEWTENAQAMRQSGPSRTCTRR